MKVQKSVVREISASEFELSAFGAKFRIDRNVMACVRFCDAAESQIGSLSSRVDSLLSCDDPDKWEDAKGLCFDVLAAAIAAGLRAADCHQVDMGSVGNYVRDTLDGAFAEGLGAFSEFCDLKSRLRDQCDNIVSEAESLKKRVAERVGASEEAIGVIESIDRQARVGMQECKREFEKRKRTLAQKAQRARARIVTWLNSATENIVAWLRDVRKVDFGAPVTPEQRELAKNRLDNVIKESGTGPLPDAEMAEIMKLDPFVEGLCEAYWQRAKDKTGPINEIARALGVCLDDVKAAELLRRAGEPRDCQDGEAAALAYYQSLQNIALRLAYPATEELRAARSVIDQIDVLARTVDNRVFSTREEAARQRQLSEFEQTLLFPTEEDAKKARESLIEFSAKLGVDGAWKMKRVNAALEDFDRRARTAFDVEYATREEARSALRSGEKLFSAMEKAVADAGEEKFYLLEKIPPKKLDGARTYLEKAQEDGVFALLDTTFFGSAKCGLSVSKWGVVWKNSDPDSTARTAYTWREFAALPRPTVVQGRADDIEFEQNVVYANDGSDAKTEHVLAVFRKFWSYVRTADLDCAFAKPEKAADAKGNPAGAKAKRKSSATAKKGSAKSKPSVRKAAAKEPVADKKQPQGEKAGRKCPARKAAAGGMQAVVAAFEKLGVADIYVGESIPEKKLRNACDSMKIREAAGAVRLLVDATVFGSAKDGLVLTDKAVYFKNFMEDPVRVAVDDLEDIKSVKKELFVNGNLFSPAVFSEAVITGMMKALKLLQK